jgi:nucleotide-binding universal stress UspA family protein
MTKRILVPLDGSRSAEAVLPIVAATARDSGGTVRLLRVEPVPENVVGDYGRVVAYADQEMARLEAKGRIYLEGARAELVGVPSETVVRFGDPADEIGQEAEAWEADLIALASGPARRRWWPRKGVAETLPASTPVPVLVYRER